MGWLNENDSTETMKSKFELYRTVLTCMEIASCFKQSKENKKNEAADLIYKAYDRYKEDVKTEYELNGCQDLSLEQSLACGERFISVVKDILARA